MIGRDKPISMELEAEAFREKLGKYGILGLEVKAWNDGTPNQFRLRLPEAADFATGWLTRAEAEAWLDGYLLGKGLDTD